MAKRHGAAVAAAVALLAGCASTPPAPQSALALTGVWTFDFDAGPGVATATLADSQGRSLAQVRCQAPRGPIFITDWTLSAAARSVGLRIGARDSTTPASPVTAEGRPAVMLRLAPSDPVFQAIFADAPVTLNADAGRASLWPADSAGQINTVLNACIARGS